MSISALRPNAWALWLLCSALGTGVRSEDWPSWRGANRNGVVAEESHWNGGEWPRSQPVWERTVGAGGTSPIAVAGRLYVLGWREDQDHLHCLDAASGRNLWRQSYSSPERGRHSTGDEGLYGGPSSTPEFDSATGYLYTLGIDGDVNCWDTKHKGRRVWHFNLYEKFRTPQRPRVGRSGHRDYGFTSSPLVHGDWLILEAGSPDGNLIAVDKRSGEPQWLSESKDVAGHTGGPVPMVVEDVPCVAVLTLNHLLVARLDSGHAGKTVAEYEWTTDFANNIASPCVFQNQVLITSGYNHDSICNLRITLSRGAELVWQQPFSTKICTPVVHRGHIYFAWQQLRCLDFKTGAERWAGGSFGDAGSCLVTSDDRLVVWGDQGTLALAETAERSPDRYSELARVDHIFRTDVWPHIVLAEGRLYCKDRDGNLKCFSVGQ